jgi:hypothetical protein
MGRTSLQSRQLRRSAHILGECTHLPRYEVSLASRNQHGSAISKASTEHYQPFRPFDTIFIGLRIPQSLPLGLSSLIDLVFRAMANEHWLAAPLDDHLDDVSEPTSLSHWMVRVWSRFSPRVWCSNLSQPLLGLGHRRMQTC